MFIFILGLFWDCQDELYILSFFLYTQIFAFIFIIFPSQIALSY